MNISKVFDVSVAAPYSPSADPEETGLTDKYWESYNKTHRQSDMSLRHYCCHIKSADPAQKNTQYIHITARDMNEERLGYVCNPRSLKEGTETSRRMTDEIGISPERPIHFECN